MGSGIKNLSPVFFLLPIPRHESKTLTPLCESGDPPSRCQLRRTQLRTADDPLHLPQLAVAKQYHRQPSSLRFCVISGDRQRITTGDCFFSCPDLISDESPLGIAHFPLSISRIYSKATTGTPAVFFFSVFCCRRPSKVVV